MGLPDQMKILGRVDCRSNIYEKKMLQYLTWCSYQPEGKYFVLYAIVSVEQCLYITETSILRAEL
jgi:hypothetical protein